MDTLSTHYARLLGLDDSWRVDAVDLRLDERRVEIRLVHVGSGISCPECGQSCGLADHAEDVHARFHVAKQAVDPVRRTENEALQAEEDDRLKGTRQLWLFNNANLSSAQRRRFAAIRQNGLKTARA